jgi:hypothetical protein
LNVNDKPPFSLPPGSICPSISQMLRSCAHSPLCHPACPGLPWERSRPCPSLPRRDLRYAYAPNGALQVNSRILPNDLFIGGNADLSRPAVEGSAVRVGPRKLPGMSVRCHRSPPKRTCPWNRAVSLCSTQCSAGEAANSSPIHSAKASMPCSRPRKSSISSVPGFDPPGSRIARR